MKEKILLDTDIGSDIDDAVCLAYLLANPECDLLGITTVSGEPVKRAMMASALCRLAGGKVPVFPGSELPLETVQRQPEATQASALGRWPHDTEFPEGKAVDFLADTIRRHPGEVTLLAIGPMTNIAKLFTEHPGTSRMLKRLVLMCGSFSAEAQQKNPVEWNAKCDPPAAGIVYGAPAAVHRSVGLDVTMKVWMDAGEVRERFRAKLLRPVLDFAEVWFRNAKGMLFHDPLAAATIFDANVCGFEQGSVTIDTEKVELQGRTVFGRSAVPPAHEVAVSVDAGEFFRHYFSYFA